MRELCGEAIDAATGAGAGYADARAVTRRAQHVATKNGEVEAVAEGETEGIGVRVLVDGAWGFACDRRLSEEGARAAAERAVAFARASAGRKGRRRVELAPIAVATGEYRTSAVRDPIEVPLSEKVDLCLRAEGAMEHDDVKITEATVRAQREHRAFQSSEGADVYQEFVECGGGIDALAIRDGKVQIRSYPSAHGGSSSQSGWEYVEGLDLPANAPRVAEEAAALLQADPCPSGVTTVVLDSEQMVLQVHESVGHPTELDRVYGTEAAYAGTSFLTPADLGSLRYGSELMNITADATLPGALGTFGYDDEGTPAQRVDIVKEGRWVGVLSGRDSAAASGVLPGGMVRSDGWSRLPMVRMTNVGILPGTSSLEEIIAATDDGIFMDTNRSWSIDDKRLNFQFGCEVGYEIKNGKRGRLLRNPTYTGITPEFWGSLDMLGGPDEWVFWGTPNCGKGQPMQYGHTGHPAVPGRFRNVRVGVRQRAS